LLPTKEQAKAKASCLGHLRHNAHPIVGQTTNHDVFLLSYGNSFMQIPD
jgi:hypothetical protein